MWSTYINKLKSILYPFFLADLGVRAVLPKYPKYKQWAKEKNEFLYIAMQCSVSNKKLGSKKVGSLKHMKLILFEFACLFKVLGIYNFWLRPQTLAFGNKQESSYWFDNQTHQICKRLCGRRFHDIWSWSSMAASQQK